MRPFHYTVLGIVVVGTLVILSAPASPPRTPPQGDTTTTQAVPASWYKDSNGTWKKGLQPRRFRCVKVAKLYDTRVLGIVVATHTVTLLDTIVSEQGALNLHSAYDGLRCDSV